MDLRLLCGHLWLAILLRLSMLRRLRWVMLLDVLNVANLNCLLIDTVSGLTNENCDNLLDFVLATTKID